MITPAETNDLRTELFRDDIYRAHRVFNTEQVWFDVGCHIGLFTNLAEAYGAHVAGGIDADPHRTDEYRIRVAHPAITKTITTADDIIDALHHIEGQNPAANALKMDVQGAEVPILTSSRGVKTLADRFHTLLFEYHEPESLLTALLVLETYGYGINFIDAATDALTGEPTHIVHAKASA